MQHTNQPNHAYNRPIPGQKEISATANRDKNGLWVAQEGMYIAVDMNKVAGTVHDEL